MRRKGVWGPAGVWGRPITQLSGVKHETRAPPQDCRTTKEMDVDARRNLVRYHAFLKSCVRLIHEDGAHVADAAGALARACKRNVDTMRRRLQDEGYAQGRGVKELRRALRPDPSPEERLERLHLRVLHHQKGLAASRTTFKNAHAVHLGVEGLGEDKQAARERQASRALHERAHAEDVPDYPAHPNPRFPPGPAVEEPAVEEPAAEEPAAEEPAAEAGAGDAAPPAVAPAAAPSAEAGAGDAAPPAADVAHADPPGLQPLVACLQGIGRYEAFFNQPRGGANSWYLRGWSDARLADGLRACEARRAHPEAYLPPILPYPADAPAPLPDLDEDHHNISPACHQKEDRARLCAWPCYMAKSDGNGQTWCAPLVEHPGRPPRWGRHWRTKLRHRAAAAD